VIASGDATPLVELHNVRKQYGGPSPLRVARLVVGPLDRLALAGLDPGAAEMLVLLVTGAALPDEGEVRIAGRSTRDIGTDVEWLHSLDRFGLVTERAVLIDKLSTAANMALPMTLSINPMSEDTQSRVAALAAEAGLPPQLLQSPVADLSAVERMRVHLARALAVNPSLLLLEHPTTKLDTPSDVDAIGATLKAVAAARQIGWIAMTDDARFARASGATRLHLIGETGVWRAERRRLRDWFR
jgi:predicted ABC-type transport system involved in lysophospholipase L1 biosynthesis ATPase subunit